MASKITADFSRTCGKIKPLHAMNNAPLLGSSSELFHFFTEAGIPYSRLHDTGGEYGGFRYVDIENIFRDFSRDPDDETAYDFAFTDWLLAELQKCGARPFYRLGATIENYHRIKAYHIFPPSDNLKWARICEHIIMHYNEGWADGFHYGIEYWEIWNEPDNEPEIKDNPMWKGTKEQYFELYEVSANYLKKRFPDLKIGGYASCGFYALQGGVYIPGANSSPRTDYFIDFFQAFLACISSKEHRSPLDFFSFHSYANAETTGVHADYARRELDRYGFGGAELILNEWSPYGAKFRGEMRAVSETAAMMCVMQKKPVEMLMFYDGQVNNSYGGLINPITFLPFKNYYTFRAFNELYKLGVETESIADGRDIYACAATDGDACALMVVNNSEADMTVRLALSGTGRAFALFCLDESHDLEEIGRAEAGKAYEAVIPKYSLVLAKTV